MSAGAITIDLDDFPAWLENEVDRFAHMDFTEALQEIARELRLIHAGYFANERGPSGQAWQPWFFRAAGASPNHRTLDSSGRLRESLQEGADHIEGIDGNVLTFGTSVPYAYKHQYGGIFNVEETLIGRDGRLKHAGTTIHLPQREHVGVNAEHVDSFAERLADTIVQNVFVDQTI